MLECGGTNLSSLDVRTCLFSFDPLDYDWLDEMIKVHFFPREGADNWEGVLAMVSSALDVVLSLLLVVQRFVK